MAHECPECGSICYCNGDIDDCLLPDRDVEAACMCCVCKTCRFDIDDCICTCERCDNPSHSCCCYDDEMEHDEQ